MSSGWSPLRIANLITCICSLGSLISGFYLTISCFFMWVRRLKDNDLPKAYFLTYHAFYIALSDVFWHAPFAIFCGLATMYTDWQVKKSWWCNVAGATIQLSGVFQASWYICLSLSIIFMFHGGILITTLKLQSLVVFIVAIIAFNLPLICDDYEPVSDGYEVVECWVSSAHFQLILYIPVCLSILLDLYLLIFSAKISRALPLKAHQNLSTRVFWLLLVDVLVWILPLTHRFWQMTLDRPPPLWLATSHNILLACVGMANTAIWTSTSSFEPACNLRCRPRSPEESLKSSLVRTSCIQEQSKPPCIMPAAAIRFLSEDNMLPNGEVDDGFDISTAVYFNLQYEEEYVTNERKSAVESSTNGPPPFTEHNEKLTANTSLLDKQTSTFENNDKLSYCCQRVKDDTKD